MRQMLFDFHRADTSHSSETGVRPQRYELRFEAHDAVLAVYSRKYTTAYFSTLKSAGFLALHEYFAWKKWFLDTVVSTV